MILGEMQVNYGLGACPHTRGDDPGVFYPNFIGDLLSPYAWG